MGKVGAMIQILIGLVAGGLLAALVLRRRGGPARTGPEGDAEFYRTLLEVTPTPVFVQCEGRLVIANPAAVNILGAADVDELIGRDTLEFFHPDSRDAIRRRREHVTRTGQATEFEKHRFLRLDGSDVEIETAGTPMTWRGKPAVLIVLHNMSAAMALQRETEDRESRLRLVMDATADAIITIDERGRIDMFNRAASEIFGYRAEEARGRNVSMLMSARDRDRHDGYIENYMQTGTAKILGIGPREVVGRHQDGHEIPLGLTVGEVEIGGKRMFVGALRDITERREQQALLVQAQKMEAVGQLTGGISHDFNNLLTAIIGNLELLEAGLGDDPQQQRSHEIAMRAALRGADLTQRLLAFSRRQALSPETVDVNRLVIGMRELMTRTLGASIEIETVIAGGLWPAMVDPLQLETSLLNLAINARDAMTDGGKLTIETANASLDHGYAETRQEVTPGQYVMMAVTDTGSGIAPGILERVFEPFYTTKEIGRGSGLGLSMVYGFVKQSHGHVAIYSEEGVGTTVRLYLPRATEKTKSRDSTAASLDRPMPGGSERILVVEDDPDVRFFICTTLAALGYEIRECADGPEALKLLESWPGLDMLFTDVVLPGGLNGRELAEKVLEKFPDAKVIFSSGYTQNAIVHQGKLDAGVRLLAKPYRRDTLARRVREVLDE